MTSTSSTLQAAGTALREAASLTARSAGLMRRLADRWDPPRHRRLPESAPWSDEAHLIPAPFLTPALHAHDLQLGAQVGRLLDAHRAALTEQHQGR